MAVASSSYGFGLTYIIWEVSENWGALFQGPYKDPIIYGAISGSLIFRTPHIWEVSEVS